MLQKLVDALLNFAKSTKSEQVTVELTETAIRIKVAQDYLLVLDRPPV